jgi:ribosomal protein S18 acetylase RimI-like enzyme
MTGRITRVRRARRDDAAAIARVHVETWQSAYADLLDQNMLASMSDVRQAAWWQRALADPREARGIFVVDHADMGVVGFGSCGPARDHPEGLDGTEKRVGEVYTLYVEPDFQDEGYGRLLLDAMFKQLHGEGCDTVVLWMLADNPSRFFYEAMGGQYCGQRTDTMAGRDVDEVAYAWRDLETPLVRRRLAPDEEESS